MAISTRTCRSESARKALGRIITIEEQAADSPWKFHVVVDDVKTTFRPGLDPLREHDEAKRYGAHTLEDAEIKTITASVAGPDLIP